MKRFKGILFAATMLLAMIFSCQSPTDTPTDFTVTITGTAARQSSTAADLDSVVTVLDNPYRKDTAKSNGSFSLSFTSSAKDAVTTNFRLTRPRFLDTTIVITYGPSAKNIALNVVRMKAISSTDDSVVVHPSKRPGLIVLLSATARELSIRDAGGIDVTSMTFEVRDSSGVPVDAYNQALVGFRLVTKPDAATYLSKDTARTSANGTVSVQLTAGSTAGIAQVMAFAAVLKTASPLVYDTLRSPVVSIPIHGGAPDSAHFSIGSERSNIAGGVVFNLTTAISALVGDKFGNPVQPGTVVQFRTNGGVIQSFGATNNDGAVAVTLRSGEPIPPGGLVTITAQIGGSSLSAARAGARSIEKRENAEAVTISSGKSVPKPLADYVAGSAAGTEIMNSSGTFTRTLQILFSGQTQISVPDTNFLVAVGGTKQVNFTVSDQWGNPLSGGSTILVSAAGLGAGDVELSGDVAKTIPDTKSPAYTSFRVFLRDKRTSGTDLMKPVDLRIEVTSQNGNMTIPVAGRLLSVSGSDSGRIGSITLVNSNPDSVTVNGAGLSSVPVQFKVVDVFGKPAANVPLSFEFVKTLGGGEYLTPISASTDVNGIAATTLKAGIRSGLVQIVAKVRNDSTSITSPAKSIYVRTGAASSINLVSASANKISVQGGGGTSYAVLVFEARDTLGNAIDLANQTPVRFLLRGDTAGTSISPNPITTDPATGRVVANFVSGTRSGLVQVFATARNGIVKSSPVSITIQGGLADSSHFSLAAEKLNLAGGVLFGLKSRITVLLADAYGNPVQAGTGVYFSTTGGVIPPSGTTAEDGSVSVDLTTAEPIPANGIALVSATIGSGAKSDAISALPKVLANFKRQKTETADGPASAPMTFVKTIPILFSGHTQIAVTDTNFLIPVGGVKQVNYRVSDPNGNPLSGGTSIRVTAAGQAAGDVELSGDVDKTLPDTWDKSFTIFRVTVRDRRTTGTDLLKSIDLKFDVTSPNDNATKTASGKLLNGVAGSDSGKVGKIELVTAAVDTIAVSGGGGIPTTTVQFRVSDVFDNPSPNIPVNFEITKSVGGGEYVTPVSGTSDVNGYVSTVLKSGIRSGLVQLVARVRKDSISVVSPTKSVYISTGVLAQIALISVSTNNVSVQGVGGLESAVMIFEARDSLGNALTSQTPISLFLRGDTAGTHISPNPSSTDPSTGRIIANFMPSTKAGVVQVFATGRSGQVTSAPVPITIHGGFAVGKAFTLRPDPDNKLNIPKISGQGISVRVTAGDKWSNPINPGTLIYFSSTAGIVTASSATNEIGEARANWYNVLPDSTQNGYFWIKARTLGDPSVTSGFVQDSIKFMLSGSPTVRTTSPNVVNDTVRLLDGAYSDINYIISDLLNHPISAGNKISVNLSGPAAGELELTGNTSVDMPETVDTVAGTHFTFRVGDRSAGSGKGGAFKITIAVDGIYPHVEKNITGILYAPGDIIVPPSARKPAQISYLGTTATEIFVSGVGATENATIGYEVRDSLGVPITRAERTYATFALEFFPNTFAGGGTAPTMLPSADSTDDAGRLHVSILSGSAAGVVQIRARIQTSTGVIISEPVRISVHAGFPDQKHFTIAPSQFNFPGLAKAYLQTSLTVQVGDRYSNPVQEGTAVYFNTAHGIITTGLTTDKAGFVTNTLYASNPYPIGSDTLQFPENLTTRSGPGFSRLYARTYGKASAQIIDSVDILWTGPPIIKVDPVSPSTYTIGNGGNAGPFVFTVADVYGHPMSAGTTISVSGDALLVSGTGASITLPDMMDGGPGVTSFSIMAEDADATQTTVPPKKSQLTLRVVHPVYGTYTRVLATGTVQ